MRMRARELSPARLARAFFTTATACIRSSASQLERVCAFFALDYLILQLNTQTRARAMHSQWLHLELSNHPIARSPAFRIIAAPEGGELDIERKGDAATGRSLSAR